MGPRGGTDALNPEPSLHPGGAQPGGGCRQASRELSATWVMGSELWCSGVAAGQARAGSAEKKLLEEASKDADV